MNANFFKDRGVKYENPLPIFGNSWKFVFRIRNIHLLVSDLYKKFKNEK